MKRYFKQLFSPWSSGENRRRKNRFPGPGRLWNTVRAGLRSRELDLLPIRKSFAGYTKEQARADVRAGFNVALVGVPQAIAFALIAGLHPHHGLLSVGLGAMVGAIFSGSRLVVMGPGNSTAILVFSGLMAAGLPEEQRILTLPLFIFMVGCFQIIGAMANLSLVLNYVSRSVVTAYVTAAAALIIVNQLQNLLGFQLEEGSTFFSILSGTLANLDKAHWPAILMGAGTLGLVLGLRRFLPVIPDAAAALVFAGFLARYFDWTGMELNYLTGFSLGDINYLAISFDFELIGTLAGPAFAVAFLGVVEGVSVGRSLASRSGERINPNQILFGMGLANLSNSLIGGMDASGSVTRSALNWDSGARTALSVVVSGGLALILLFTIGGLIAYVPTSALAAVVLLVAFALFNRHQITVALRTTSADAVVFLITFITALLFTLDTAIYIGVFTSIILFLRKAGVPELVEYTFTPEGQLAEASENKNEVPGICILHAEGDLFFGSTEMFVEQARQATLDPALKVVVLRLKNAHHLDASCALAIEELLHLLHLQGKHLVVSGARKDVYKVFRDSGVLDKLGRRNFFMEKHGNPTYSTRNALRRAQELVGHKEADVRIFVDKRKQQQQEETGKQSKP